MAQIANKQDAIAFAVNAGGTAANGFDSLMAVAKVVYLGCKTKSFTPDDAPDIYDAYAQGVNASEFGAKINRDRKATGFKSSASTLKQFGRLGVEQKGMGGWALIERTNFVLDRMENPGSKYQKTAKVIRAALKAKRSDFDEAAIATLLTPVKKNPDVFKELTAIASRCEAALKKPEFLEFSAYFSTILDTANEMVALYKSCNSDSEDDSEDDAAEMEEAMEALAAQFSA